MNLFQVYPLFDVEPVKAKGNYVYDAAGQKYLDFYGGHAVISIGHSHPHYVERVNAQLNEIGFYSNSVPISIQEQLAKKLGNLSGYSGWNLFLCNSGAEANENALKVASAHNQRKKIIAFKGGFHGRTSLAVSVTDNPTILFPVNEGADVIRFAFEDFEGVESALKNEDVSSVIIEGIQGVGGIVAPSFSFLNHLRKLCNETGTVLILDEVQSGFGRTGEFFAHQLFGVEPDIITMAKGMGNGFPVGGVLIHPKFKASFVLEQEKLISNAKAMGRYLEAGLSQLPKVKEVRAFGLMVGVEFEEPVAEWRKKLLYKHYIFTGSSSNKNVLRLLPPLSIGKEECDELIQALKKVLK